MRRQGRTWFVRCAVVLWMALPPFALVARRVDAQGSVRCDTALMRRAVGVQGYRRYGERCEGVFRENVGAAATLWVASFTRAFDPIDTRASLYVQVTWPVAVDQEVRIAARSIRRNLYYAMDTWRPPGDTAWRWPTTILDGQNIHREDIGVLAWTTWRFGDKSATVYLPLSISSSPRAADTSIVYSLVVFPTEPLDSMYLTLARLGPDGRPQSVKPNEPVSQAFFFAERPVVIPIRDPGPTGIYSARLSARYAGGKILTLDPILFHHVARR